MVALDPWAHDTPGARALAAIYDEFVGAIDEELDTHLRAHPVFGRMAASLSQEAIAKQREEARARIGKAFTGRWDEYVTAMRGQGRAFAMLGVGYADWQLLIGAWMRAMIPRLVLRYAAQPELLSASLLSMHSLMDRAKIILGESFIEASESQLRLRQAELERWEAIFRHVVWGVVVADAEGTIELANPAFARLVGIDALITGHKFGDFFAPGELDRIRANYSEDARRDGRTSYEVELALPDGKRAPVLVEAAQIPSGAASGRRWAINVIDLTERKKAEQLQRRSNELEAENRRIQDASRSKSEFLANMSHELRTPLNAIIGFADLLHLNHVGEMPPRQHEFIGDILRSARHLLRLINDVLDLSKVESGTLQFSPESLDLHAVAAEVQSVLAPVATERGITIETHIDERMHDVSLDPLRIKQILYNFLSNGLKFGPSGSRVRLRIELESAFSIRIEVEDEGTGIPAEQQHRLFVQFEQLDSGSGKRHSGTGLGLALTRRLVEAQGGTVAVRSEPGKGAVFSAVLPRRSGRASLPEPRHIAALSDAAPRVLVVEDDPRDQERIVQTLVTAGYAVDTAATGAQAQRACEEQAYDAITLDLVLPDASGLELLGAIRATAGNAKVPVVIISVVSDEVANGVAVHDVLPKPIDEKRLLGSLASAGITSPSMAPVLVVEDDDASAKLMIEALASLGLRVVWARDGRDAIRRAETSKPCAVVLDLVMPGTDGFTFLAEFRARPEWATVPVFIWTVLDLGPEAQASVLRSAQAVLHKDGSGVRGLIDTLQAHLRAGAAGPT